MGEGGRQCVSAKWRRCMSPCRQSYTAGQSESSAVRPRNSRGGHKVVLFASGDSQTSARLVPCAPQGLRLNPDVRDSIACTIRELGRVTRMADDLDVIHNHIDYFAFPYTRLLRTPVVTTLHGRLDLPEVRAVFEDFPEVRLVSISSAQRAPLPTANWLATVRMLLGLRADAPAGRLYVAPLAAWMAQSGPRRQSPGRRCARRVPVLARRGPVALRSRGNYRSPGRRSGRRAGSARAVGDRAAGAGTADRTELLLQQRPVPLRHSDAAYPEEQV